MLVKAYSKEMAISIAQKNYGYSPEHIKIIPIKKPINIFWGLIKRRGKYKIDIITSKEKYDKEKNEEFKNGWIEIRNRAIKVRDPIENGRYPYIIAEDPNIDIYINGTKKKGTFIVEEKDIIEIKPKHISPVTKVSVELSEDKLKAILKIHKKDGKKFYVKDVKRDVGIKICSEYEKIEPRNVDFDECIQALKDAGVKLEFINYSAINKLINSSDNIFGNSSVIVARGIPPIDGEKAQIEYYFDYLEQDSYYDGKYSENYIKNTQIVHIGDVLANKVSSSKKGKDGLTVTGEVIKAKEFPDEPLKAGEGVVILDNGSKAVAISDGRPVLKNGVISVVPLLIISKNLDKEIGDIDFHGDVIIKGNVMDNMKVVSKRDVKVLGSAYNSEIIASGDIEILGKVIGCKIRAGANVIEYISILPQLKNFEKIIRKLLENIKNNNKIDIPALQDIIKINKSIIEKSIKEIDKVMSLMEKDKFNKISDLLKRIRKLLFKNTGLYGKDIMEIVSIYKEVVEYINSIQTLYKNDTKISFQYAQNSMIQSCGDIIITGEGSYRTSLFAKDKIIYKKFSSSAKGGILVAGKRIKAGEVGSSTGIHTYCRILDEKGEIQGKFYSGTIINIKDKVKII
ncbi:FapA family protein [Defluviitalea phaphyphila]|uniref:FapA family protein n=1 Tax=Defluviitalea phaphyphila TaxID=1473580 RepID=UPI000731B764|nr:FapA family protein [Defluviitalea phaphyphila]